MKKYADYVLKTALVFNAGFGIYSYIEDSLIFFILFLVYLFCGIMSTLCGITPFLRLYVVAALGFATYYIIMFFTGLNGGDAWNVTVYFFAGTVQICVMFASAYLVYKDRKINYDNLSEDEQESRRMYV